MKIFTKIERDRYIDSLETLSETAILNEQPGIETGYVGMATNVFKDVIEEIGLSTPEIEACTEADYVIVASAESEEAFTKAVETVWAESAPTDDTEKPESYLSSAAAKEAEPRANLCQISVPGEYALEEVKRIADAVADSNDSDGVAKYLAGLLQYEKRCPAEKGIEAMKK